MHVKDLIKEMIKNRPSSANINNVFSVIKGMLRYIENNESEEYEVNQGMLGMQELFREYAVKVWKGVDFSKDDYKGLNKILV